MLHLVINVLNVMTTILFFLVTCNGASERNTTKEEEAKVKK